MHWLQVFRRQVQVSIGPCSITLSAISSPRVLLPEYGRDSLSSARLVLEARGMHVAVRPPANPSETPTATVRVHPLSARLVTPISDPPRSPAHSRGSGTGAAHAPVASAEPVSAATSMTSALSGSTPRRRASCCAATEESQMRSTLVAQVAVAQVSPAADEAAALSASGVAVGCGDALAVRGLPEDALTISADLDSLSSGEDTGSRLDVSVQPSIMVVDGEMLPAALSVAARVLAPVTAGGSSSGSASTGVNVQPAATPAPRALHAAHAHDPTAPLQDAVSAPFAASESLSCEVSVGALTLALLQPAGNILCGMNSVSIVAHTRMSASLQVTPTATRGSVEFPRTMLYATPCAACAALCTGSAPLHLRPQSCAFDSSRMQATVDVAAMATCNNQGAEGPRLPHHISRLLCPDVNKTDAAPGSASCVKVGLDVRAVKVAVGAEEVAAVQQLAALSAMCAALLDPIHRGSDASHSTRSTGTPPATRPPSMPASMPPSLMVPSGTYGSGSTSVEQPYVHTTGGPSKTLVDSIVDGVSAALRTLRAAALWTFEFTLHEAEATLIQRHAVAAMHAPHALEDMTRGRGGATWEGLVVTPLVGVFVRPKGQRRTVAVAATAAGVAAEAAAAMEVGVLNMQCQQWDVLVEEWPIAVRAGMHQKSSAQGTEVSNC